MFIVTGKGAKGRIVPIGKQALEWITKYLEDVRPKFIQGDEVKTLFLGHKGVPFKLNTISSIVAKYVKAAELEKGGSSHQFRRASATHMVQGKEGDDGIKLMHLKEILGHVSLNSTQRYLKLNIEEIKKAHEKFHPSEDT